eukprot:Seg304.1_Seg304.3 transcript_id=Seg304.1_Seg304.3/GoldUCD/mRNA.D3Y31 product="Solute carrier family 22 member 6-A" protein_id=Seg304.1_Seg304.3/GoldUCD/D3Y31
MDASKIISVLGNPGRFTIVLFSLFFIGNTNLAMNHMIYAIYGATPTHGCNLPKSPTAGNWTQVNSTNNINKYYQDDGQCTILERNNGSLKKVPCTFGWKFDLEQKQSTIVTEWSLVCGERYLGSLAISTYFVGVMVGGVLFGSLSDKYGGRKVIIGTMYLQLVVGVAASFAPSFTVFVILRFFVGFLVQGNAAAAVVMLMEMTPLKTRPLLAGIYEVSWSTGTIFMSCLAWLIKDWRKIQLALALQTIYCVFYYWLVPDSIRWCMINKEPERAMAAVRKIAKFNKVTLSDDVVLEENNNMSKSSYTFLDLLKTKVIRTRSLCMFNIWMTASVVYYGTSLNIATLTGNLYLNIFVSSLIELPALVFAAVLFRWVGRRSPIICYFALSGTACIIAGSLPMRTGNGKDLTIFKTIFAFIGKFFVSAAFSTLKIFTTELFPTVVRNTAFGCCIFWTRVGGVIAPQILLLGIYTIKELPYVLFGIISLSAAVTAWILPETKGMKLLDTIEEVEGFTKQEHELSQNLVTG